MNSLEILSGLFILIGLGYLAKRTLLAGQSLTALNSYVFYIAVPALLFDSASQLDAQLLWQPLFIGVFLLAAVITGLLTLIGSRLLLTPRTGPEQVQMALNATFANYAYLGIPLVFGLLGQDSYAAVIIVILAGNLFLIGGAQLLIELQLPQQQGSVGLKRLWQLLNRSLLRNPIFLATVSGVTVSSLEWQLPAWLTTPVQMLSPSAIPVALFCLGAGLTFGAIGRHRLELGWLLLAKLVVHPLLTWGCLRIAGIEDPNWLVPAVLLTALPTGALAHVVAQRYQLAEQQTSLLILLSTLGSIASLSVWIEILV